MKNILVSTLLVLGFSSCSKDSLDSVSYSEFSIAKSEIIVSVTYLTWDDQNCDLGCGGSATQSVSFISNAKVELYSGEFNVNDVAASTKDAGLTDKEGSIIFEDLDPGQYTILVDTPYGQKSRTIYTQLNKRSSIEFSF